MRASEALIVFVLAAASASSSSSSSSSSAVEEHFHEELLMSPLANSDVMGHLRFTTTSPASQRHFRLFPRAVAELMMGHGLRELDVSLTRGVWREQLRGYAPKPAPAGASVSALFDVNKVAGGDVDLAWTRLTNALSGQLCASLNFLDATRSFSPAFSFVPRGVATVEEDEDRTNATHFRMGMLPGENVCTENLTPWKKLLPCEAKRGLATLLNAANVHRSKYHSLGLSLRLVCPQSAVTCTQPHLEFTQYLTVVFDPHMDHKDPDQTRPLSWSLRSLFGIGLVSACPLADTSKIYIDTTENLFSLQPSQNGEPLTKDGRTVQAFDLPTLLSLGVTNVIANYHKPTIFGIIRSPVLHASRYLVGHGQEKGGIITKIVNKHTKPVRIILMETVPWYLRLFLHTLNVSTEVGQKITPLKQHFVPGRDRDRPYVLELVLELPARSVTKVSVEFEKSLLRWLEYPPDANHGFYVSAATITAFLPSAANLTSVGRFCSTYDEYYGAGKEADLVVQLFTETLLVNLPTPDFSMPYNVICLACTVVALAFGPLHNITTKTLVMEEGEQKKSIVARTIAFIKQKLPFGNKEEEPPMTEEEPPMTEEEPPMTEEEPPITDKEKETKKSQ